MSLTAQEISEATEILNFAKSGAKDNTPGWRPSAQLRGGDPLVLDRNREINGDIVVYVCG